MDIKPLLQTLANLLSQVDVEVVDGDSLAFADTEPAVRGVDIEVGDE